MNRNTIAKEKLRLLIELARPIKDGGFALTDDAAQKVITDILESRDGGSAVILELKPIKGVEMAKDIVNRIIDHLIRAGEMKKMGGKRRHSKRNKKQRRKTRRSTRS